jgi:hypothetical protein
MSGTMDCMMGAENEFNDPVDGSRNGESSGASVAARITRPSTMTRVAHQNAFRSRGWKVPMSGASSASWSTGVETFSRGSMTASVMNHPNAMMSRLEVAVKK